MDELLPCPVCGSHPVHHTNVSTPLTEDWCRWVGCVDESCLAGPYRRTQTEAIAAWNTLSRAARLLAAVEAIETINPDARLWRNAGQVNWYTIPSTGSVASYYTLEGAILALAKKVTE